MQVRRERSAIEALHEREPIVGIRRIAVPKDDRRPVSGPLSYPA